MLKNQIVNEWVAEHPLINPFSACYNIANLGGADLYWAEFKYRYGEREIFNSEQFVSAVERIFLYNKYKYERLLATTLQEYDMFTNYKLQKAGSETNTYDVDDKHTGTDTRRPNIQKQRTDNLSQNETSTPRVETTTTETPTVKTKETVTPTVKSKDTTTPTVKTKETDIKGTVVTTTTTPEGYTDEVSRTTYDSSAYNAVQKTVHTAGLSGSTTVTPSGLGDTKTTEVLSGNTIVEHENVSGNVETVKEVVSGTNQTVESKTGTDTTVTTNTGTSTTNETGNETTEYNTTKSKDGTETLSFTNRVDSGYMYREPQNAIKDEREIAAFTILDDILSDVERATLLSIYLY